MSGAATRQQRRGGDPTPDGFETLADAGAALAEAGPRRGTRKGTRPGRREHIGMTPVRAEKLADSQDRLRALQERVHVAPASRRGRPAADILTRGPRRPRGRGSLHRAGRGRIRPRRAEAPVGEPVDSGGACDTYRQPHDAGLAAPAPASAQARSKSR